MNKELEQETLDIIEKAQKASNSDTDNENYIPNNDHLNDEFGDNDVNEICIRLDPVDNIAEVMAVAVDGLQIHYGVMQMIRLENIFSEKAQSMNDEEKDKLFADECKKVYAKQSLLKPYIQQVITNIMESSTFNYVKKLPRLFLMTSFYQKKNLYDPNNKISYYKITEINEDGDFIIGEHFEKIIKIKSQINPEFVLEFITQVWTKRLTEKTSFEVLKKKIQEFLKEKLYLEGLKNHLYNYLNYQEGLTKEIETLKQKIKSEHTNLRKG